jgi:hypothetical protein
MRQLERKRELRLAAMTSLAPLSKTLPATRRSLHLIAFYAFSYARQQHDGEVWLTPTPGGLGTPDFDGRVLRFEESNLVSRSHCLETVMPITTLRDALAFSRVEYDLPRAQRNDIEIPEDLDEVLEVTAADVELLGSFFALGQSVLEELLTTASDAAETLPRLWSEHFDLAIELGSEATKSRASIGFSGGDVHISEPYIYVAPWWKDETKHQLQPTDPFGVALRYTELLKAESPRAEALSFLSIALAKLSPASRGSTLT